MPRERAMTSSTAVARIRDSGRDLGFDLVAIGPAGPTEHGAALGTWLDAGHAGSMEYLERGREKRLDPTRVLPGAKSVVACALGYFQGFQAEGPPGVARYAWGEDYHAVMEPRLRELAATVDALVPGSTSRAYVDTGPLLERDLAARAGLGWIGKNTMLLHPDLGSFFFIGTVLTTAELPVDSPVPDRCGTCTRCLDACPTGAFVDPYVLDARRCIAYLTIEHRGPIPPELRPGVGAWAFGCDVCQDVCPWNSRAPVASEAAFRPRQHPPLADLLALDEAAYLSTLRGSPLKRARREGLARNAAVALGNRARAEDEPPLQEALGHASPTVRGHAAWALGRMGGLEARAALLAARSREADPLVLEEIERALGDVSSGRAEEERALA
jgi:epoxyqueuosine reductase